jgi:hypothetical protein
MFYTPVDVFVIKPIYDSITGKKTLNIQQLESIMFRLLVPFFLLEKLGSKVTKSVRKIVDIGVES